MSELVHVSSGGVSRYAQADLASGVYTIRFPAGARLWRVGITTYLSDEPAYAIASFYAPPDEANGIPLGPDTRYTLQRLWGGETLTFDSPPRSGTLSISAPESTDTFVTSSSRTLYLQISFPSGKALKFTSQFSASSDYVEEDVSTGVPSNNTSTNTPTKTAAQTLPAKKHIQTPGKYIKCYVVPKKHVGTLFIGITNNLGGSCKFRLALGTTRTPKKADFIVFDQELAPYGSFFKNGLVCSPGEIIFVSTDSPTLTVRIEGMLTDLTKV